MFLLDANINELEKEWLLAMELLLLKQKTRQSSQKKFLPLYIYGVSKVTKDFKKE